MPTSLLALQWSDHVTAVVIAVVLFGVLLAFYLVKEIRDGKAELGPVRRLGPRGHVTLGAPAPTGAGDNNPGRAGDPAPGQPDGQANPYGERARRGAPPIQS